MRKARKWKINKVRLLIYAVIVLLIVYFGVSAIKIVKLNAEHSEVVAENEELLQKRESLQLKLENINSPDYIESQARSDLKLVKPNELLFIFPDGSYGDSDEAEKAAKDEKADDAKNSEDKSEDKQSSEKETDGTKDTDNGENKN